MKKLEDKTTIRQELFLFFLISFLWMWGLNFIKFLASRKIIELPNIIYSLLGYVAVFGPLLSSLILTLRFEGQKKLKSFIKNGWKVNFNKKWIIIIILFFPIVTSITIILMKLFNIEIPWEYSLPPAMIVPIGLIIWLLGAFPEEYGWRGYAQPRMYSLFSIRETTIILGIVWAIWHLPLHFIPGTTQYNIPFWQYGLQTIVLTTFYSYIYQKTSGSVFAASLFHAMGNITGAVIPYWAISQGRWISFILLLILALTIYIFEFKEKQ